MTPYSHRRQVGDRSCDDVVAVRWPQIPGPVRAMLVVVRDILIQDGPEVPWPGDQHPVGDLGPDGAHPAFGIGVRPRALWRDLHYLDPGIGERSVEGFGELPSPVPDQGPEPGGTLLQAYQHVSGLLGGPGAVRDAVTPRTCT